MEPTPAENTTTEIAVEAAPQSAAPAVDTGMLLLVAAIVTASIQALKRSGAMNRVPRRWIPVISVVISIAGASAASISNGHDLTQSLIEGLLAGLSATGLYEMGKPRPAPEAAS
jgi:hypothetical protein